MCSRLLDSDTGKTVGDNGGVVPLPTGVIATHPDWNAKGDLIAITLGTKGGNKEVQGGSIALLPYNAGKWGAPMALVPNGGGDDNNFFPVWSPDGKYIAFVNATGNSNNATSAVLKLVVVADGSVKAARTTERTSQRSRRRPRASATRCPPGLRPAIRASFGSRSRACAPTARCVRRTKRRTRSGLRPSIRAKKIRATRDFGRHFRASKRATTARSGVTARKTRNADASTSAATTWTTTATA